MPTTTPSRGRGPRFAGLAILLALGVGACGGSPAPERPPNVVFVLIDTLRADHLGCYGYERPTSPNIDRIAARGIRFEHVFSVSNWTNPTIVSLFTGRYPQAVLPPAEYEEVIRLSLPANVPTLAGLLRDAGYRTAGLVDHPGISRRLGFDRGFDDYEMLFEVGGTGNAWGLTDAKYVERAFERTLDELGGGDRPFYVYLHLVYPHQPYDAPRQYDGLFGPGHDNIAEEQRDRVINDYDAEIRFTDDLIGKVFAALEARGLLDSTWLVLTSDHGEGFWEHGLRGHGKTFHNAELKVPLILLPPGGRTTEPAVVDAPVSNIDLFPTLAAMAGVEPPAGTDGTGLFRYLGEGPPPAPETFFSESPDGRHAEGRAVIEGPLKFIDVATRRGRERRLYEWKDDPGETRNLVWERRDESIRMLELLGDHEAATGARRATLEHVETDADPETLERLRALGYIDD